MRLLSNEEMRQFDLRSAEIIPEILLMENAGRCMSAEILRNLPPPAEVIICAIAGSGHNAGDLFVALRHIGDAGYTTELYLLSEKLKPLPQQMLSMLASELCTVYPVDGQVIASCTARISGLSARDVLVDGYLGSGVSRPLFTEDSGKKSTELANLVNTWNRSPAKKFALDVPSGASSDSSSAENVWPVFNADVTLACQYPRDFLYTEKYRRKAGRVVALEIGFPAAMLREYNRDGRSIHLLEASDLSTLFPPFAHSAHKGTRGKLEVHAGSIGYEGAAILACNAAAAAAAGMICLAEQTVLESPASQGLKAAVIRGGVENHWPDCLLAGPGWGANRAGDLADLLDRGIPAVLDAQALTAAADLLAEKKYSPRSTVVLTPHPGEAARLLGKSIESVIDRPYETVSEIAELYSCICVLKGSISHIGDSSGVFAVVDGGNPAMWTARTGDVLAGLIAGILCGRNDGKSAVQAGVLCHSLAGLRCFRKKGWFSADELVDAAALLLGEIQQDTLTP